MSTDERGKARAAGALDVRELCATTWGDFERVLGSNGGARGCWCMHWRLSIADWTEGKGEGNKTCLPWISAVGIDATDEVLHRYGTTDLRRYWEDHSRATSTSG